MIPREVKEEHGYKYDHKNQSPLLVEMWQHDVEDLMFTLDKTIRYLEWETGGAGSSMTERLKRHKQLMQGRIEKHKDRDEWRT